jgi:hypothetical protein
MNIKITYKYNIMIYTYDKIIDISLKINKTNCKLNDNTLQIINNLKKQLNIPITEILKKTTINKQDDISQIFKILNKLTDKNYDKLKPELFKIIENINNLEEITKITELIFKIASSNIFFSNIFSKLYFELIQIKKEFYNVFQERFDIHTQGIYNLNYVDPNINYDEYCLYIKRVEYLKSSLTFFINLMKHNICSLDNIVELCERLQNELLSNKATTEQNEEYINNIYIIIKECIDYLIFHNKMETIYENINKIKSLNISKKINFKCMDIIDIIKQCN